MASLQIGTDADLIIIDMEASRLIDGRKLYTKCGWIPYDGRLVRGLPTHTVCRGKIVCAEGRIVGERGYGRFVPVLRE